MLKRTVDSISKANRSIQRRKTNWKFLWNSWELTTVAGTSIYAGPTGLGSFDETSFWKGVGTTDAQKVTFIKYKDFREVHRQAYITSDEVQFITLQPDGRVKLLPTPVSSGEIITGEYWRKPVDLTSDAQISLIPEQFHDIIIARAKVYMAEMKSNNGWYQAGMVEFDDIYAQLKAHSLPGYEDDNKSESSISRVIEVI